MPMLNSLMRSFSDYFEESSDATFDFIFMKFGKDEQFNYFKCNQEDVNRLFNILDENEKLKYVLGSPIGRDSSYSDFYRQVKDLYPGIQPNWFLYNQQLHKKVQASYEGLLSSYVKPSADTLTDFNPSIGCVLIIFAIFLKVLNLAICIFFGPSKKIFLFSIKKCTLY